MKPESTLILHMVTTHLKEHATYFVGEGGKQILQVS